MKHNAKTEKENMNSGRKKRRTSQYTINVCWPIEYWVIAARQYELLGRKSWANTFTNRMKEAIQFIIVASHLNLLNTDCLFSRSLIHKRGSCTAAGISWSQSQYQ